MRPYKYGARGQSALQSVNGSGTAEVHTKGCVKCGAECASRVFVLWFVCRFVQSAYVIGGAEHAAEPRASYAQRYMRQLWPSALAECLCRVVCRAVCRATG